MILTGSEIREPDARLLLVESLRVTQASPVWLLLPTCES